MEPFATGPDGLVRRTAFVRAGRNDRALRRAAERGELVSLAPGVFISRDTWSESSARRRHLLRAAAVAERLREGAVFSHETAAAIHGWKYLADWSDIVSATDPGLSRTRRGASSHTHALHLQGRDVDVKNSLPVTGPGRSALDVAITLPFRNAVVTLDSALAPLTRAELRARGDHGSARTVLDLQQFDAALARRLPIRGHNHVARVRQFADGRAGSVGESFSRVVMHERGWPPPVLQQPFHDAYGLIGYVDFWWPGCGVIGEFDGVVKYSRGEMLAGLTPAEAAIQEKRREDRLRAHPLVRGFARWMWNDITRPIGMEAILAGAGLSRA